MMKEERIEHPSFGMAQWSRVQGTGKKDLFGSSIEHSNTMILEISTASLQRNLSRDWIAPCDTIISVEFSPTQFTDFITSPNTSGTPCTIRFTRDTGYIEGVEIPSKRKQFENEFKEDLRNIGKNFEELESFIASLSQKSNLTKADKEGLKSKVFEVRRIIDDYIPFAQKSFNEQLDRSVTEAKSAIEEFVQSKVRTLGEGVLKNDVKLIGE